MTIGNIQIIKILAGKWKHIAIIAGIAAVVGVVVSLPVIMKPKYKSESVVYPSNLGPYSLESPTEQLMQLLQSRKLKAKLLRDQQLWKNYKLDTLDPQFDFYYTAIFDENVKFNQTRFESVTIEVFDRDPDKAQSINKAILRLLNIMVKEMHDEKTMELKDMYGKQMIHKQKNIDSVNNGLKELRTKYGILDYAIQAREATRSYYKALASGKSAQTLSALKAEIELLREQGGKYLVMDKMLHEEVMDFENIKREYEAKIRDLGKKFSYTTIVADPNRPVKKAWPVRWLVVVSCVFSAVFLAILYYLFADRLKKAIKE
jgi:uncharacterized protein involved in exopolysaccharide biosynthesis